jgi:hypothetical protein
LLKWSMAIMVKPGCFFNPLNYMAFAMALWVNGQELSRTNPPPIPSFKEGGSWLQRSGKSPFSKGGFRGICGARSPAITPSDQLVCRIYKKKGRAARVRQPLPL